MMEATLRAAGQAQDEQSTSPIEGASKTTAERAVPRMGLRTTYESLIVGAITPERAQSLMSDADARGALSQGEYDIWVMRACPRHYNGTTTVLSSVWRTPLVGFDAAEVLADNWGRSKVVFYGSVPTCTEIDSNGRILGHVFEAASMNKPDRRMEGMTGQREVELDGEQMRELVARLDALEIDSWPSKLQELVRDSPSDDALHDANGRTWQVFYRQSGGAVSSAQAALGQDLARHSELIRILRELDPWSRS